VTPGVFPITVNVTYDNLDTGATQNLTVYNVEPNVSVIFNASSNDGTKNITCYGYVNDSDNGQNWNISWTVYNGSQHYANGSILTTTPRTWTFLKLVDASVLNGSTTWYCNVTVNDSINVSAMASANITITTQVPPNITSIVINTTRGRNITTENLTAYVAVSDVNFDPITLIHDWRINGTSIAVVNMNFDLNNSAGTNKTKDYSMYGNNGTLGAGNAAPTWNAAGGWGSTGAHSFDGGDYIDLGNPATLPSGTSPRTMCVWAKPTTVDSNFRWAVAYGTAGSSQAMFIGLNSATLYVGGYSNDITVSNFWTAGVWKHICLAYDGTTATVYINGAYNTSAAKTWNLAQNTAYIGRQVSGSEYWIGAIDEVRIYNRSLSAQQVAAIYANRSDLIVSQDLSIGQNWTDCVTPNDGLLEGNMTCSNAVYIQSHAPTLTSVILNSTTGANTTSENLTAYPQNPYDINDDNISYAHDWRINNNSIAVLNMNFDVNNSAGTGKTRDYSIFGNNGTLGTTTAAPTWNATGGMNGTGAYMFDGGDYINIPASTTFDTQRLTLSARVYASSYDQQGHIFEKGDVNTQYSFFFYDAGAGEFYFRTVNSVGTQNDLYDTSANLGITNNAWHHIVATYDGSYKRIYVDGVERKNASYTETLRTGLGTAERIGAYGGGSPSFFFNGKIDNLVVYNRSLSAEQIAALYNNRSDLIVTQELAVLQNWTDCVTPNDGNSDGATYCSNPLLITAPYAYCPDSSGIWTVSSNYTLTTNVICDTINVTNNASIIINSSAAGYSALVIRANNVTIDVGSQITAAGTGYRGGGQNTVGNGPGNSTYGQTGGGASHAGWGGRAYSTNTPATISYGSITQPTAVGSGAGGGDNLGSRGGNGGGAIIINTTTINNNGTISAEGTQGNNDANNGGGGGSGGSIWIITNTLAGTGNISANGGKGGNNTGAVYDGGGGGAGRISIWTTTNTLTGRISAQGGDPGGASPATTGGPGTIYYNDSDALIIDNGAQNQDTTMHIGSVTFTTINVSNASINGTSMSATNSFNILNTIKLIYVIINNTGTLNMQAGSTLTTEQTTNTQIYTLNITANTINILSGASINVSGKGYSGGGQNTVGNGPGNSTYGQTAGGASHAGWGGRAYSTNTPSTTIYGDMIRPTMVGSGAGGGDNSGSRGGNGGGAILLNTTTINNNGTISAEGTQGNNDANNGGGGGSGGSIWIITNTLAGTGNINVNGGKGGNNTGAVYDGGGGGAGRISIWTTTNTHTGRITAQGGDSGGTSPAAAGQDGTVYLCSAASGFSCPDSYGSISLNTFFTRNYTANVTRNLTGAWNSNFMTWTDGSDAYNQTARYNITGINQSADFKILINGLYNTTLTSTAQGTLNFSENISGSKEFVLSSVNIAPSFTMALNGSKNQSVIYDNEDLLCLVKYNDSDDSTNYAYWTFYNGTTQYQNGTTTITTQNVWTTVANISYTIANAGENWNCSVIVGDAEDNATQQSQNRTISPAVQINITLSLNVSEVNAGEQFIANGTLLYANGTPFSNTLIDIYRNGTLVSGGTLGSGIDGALSLSSGSLIVNNYTHIMTSTVSAGARSFLVNSTAGFAVGDVVLLLQSQNGSNGIAGTYEHGTIASISGMNVTLEYALANTYYSGTFNATTSTSSQLVRVPQYTAVTLSGSASIVPKAWDGYSGGIIAIKSIGTVTIGSGTSINASAKGYRTGPVPPSNVNFENGYTGESTKGYRITRSPDQAQYTLGGGGTGNGASGGGGGGAYSTAGTTGGSGAYGIGGTGATTLYGITNLTRILFGGAGGTTGSHDSGRYGAVGGNGGGIILIEAGSINNTGLIEASGQKGGDGTNTGDGNSGAGGGGGAGGSILLKANTLTLGTNLTRALQGAAGLKDPASNGADGGIGGYGRIALYGTITGSSTPTSAYNDTGFSNSNTCMTNSTGEYRCTLTSPAAPGLYRITTNITLDNLYAEASQNLTVLDDSSGVITYAANITPTTAYANSVLQGWCNGTATTLTATYHYQWYRNRTLNTTGYANNGGNNYTNGISFNIANISSGLAIGQNWTFACRATDGTTNGSWMNSTTINISNYIPNASIIVNSTRGTNSTTENLTAYTTITDPDGQSMNIIHDWRINGTSIAVLNMNFDVNNSNGTGSTRSYSTHSNNGSVIGANWNATGGWNGTGGYQFSGTSSYLSVPDQAYWDASNFTIIVRAKWTSISANWWEGALVSHDAGSGANNKWIFSYDDTNHYTVFHINDGTNTGPTLNGNTWTASTGTWYFLAVTKNGTNYSFYREGVYDGSGTSSFAIQDASAPLRIGFAEGSSTFNGAMDDVRIFNRTLSSQEIAAIYANRSDVIVSQELSVGQNWTDCVTPNDGETDGTTVCSDGVLILEGSIVISNVTATASLTSADITWDTNLESNSSVAYGTTTSLGSTSEVNDAVTSHNRSITGLNPSTIYYYNITSCAQECTTSGPHNFTTLSPSCVGATANFTCGQTVTQSCTLNGNLSCNGTAFAIGAPSIVVDGDGFTIAGNGSGAGINNSGGHDAVTIQEFIIANFTNGVLLVNADNDVVNNNTFNTSDTAVTITTSNNVNVTANNITVRTGITNSYGVYVVSGDDAFIGRNTINTSDLTGYGIYLDGADVIRANVTSNTIMTAGASAYGISFSITVNATIQNNTVTSSAGGIQNANSFAATNTNILDNHITGGMGIGIAYANDTRIEGNTINTTTGGNAAIYLLASTAIRTTIRSNTIASSQQIGVHVAGAPNTTIYNNTISSGDDGIYIQSSPTNLNITSNSIRTHTNTNAPGIYGVSGDDIIIDQNVINTTTGSSPGIFLNGAIVSRTIMTSNTIVTTSSEGIFLTSSPNATVWNNTILSGSFGVFVNANRANITGNDVTATGGGGAGVYVAGDDSVIESNHITTNNTNADGVYVNGATSERNNILSNTITTTANGRYGINLAAAINTTVWNNTIVSRYSGIYLTSVPVNTNISENNITTTLGGADGINLINGNNTNILRNVISTNTTSSHGIELDGADVLRTVIEGNTITTSGTTSRGINVIETQNMTIDGNTIYSAYCGVYLSTTHANITIASNNITTYTNANAYGIYSLGGTDIVIGGNNINTTTSSSHGIRLQGTVRPTLESNTITTNSSTAYSVYINAGSNATIYANTFSTADDAIYLTSTPTNTNITSNNITTNTNSGADGIYADSGDFILIDRNRINTTTSLSNGVYILNTFASTPTITSNTITTNSTNGDGIVIAGTANARIDNNMINTASRGISLASYASYVTRNTNITNNNITTHTGSIAYGIAVIQANDTRIEQNNIGTSSATSGGIQLYGTSTIRPIVRNNTITTSGTTAYGVFNSALNASISSNAITTTNSDSLFLATATTTWTNLSQNTLNTGGSYRGLNVSTAGLNGTTLHDQPIARYYFAGNNRITIVNSTAGILEYIGGVNGTGNSLTSDIQITDNRAEVNSSQAGLNKPANITLYNVPGFSNPAILRNGTACPSTTCTNLTPLSDTTVKFNVTGFTYYSIGEGNTCTPPSINNNWLVQASDYCVLTNQAVTLGTGKLTVNGTGNIRLINTNITASNIDLVASGGLARIYLENGSRLVRPMS